MKKYSTVEVKCFKDSKFCHYEEHYQNITPDQLEKELNVLVGAGWTRFHLIINGDEKQKIKIDYQAKPNADKKSPVKSTINNDENPSNRLKPRLKQGLKSNQKRIRKSIGTHWCGGRLYSDGHRAVRCAKCHRVKFVR